MIGLQTILEALSRDTNEARAYRLRVYENLGRDSHESNVLAWAWFLANLGHNLKIATVLCAAFECRDTLWKPGCGRPIDADVDTATPRIN